jgi:hypothetical protein
MWWNNYNASLTIQSQIVGDESIKVREPTQKNVIFPNFIFLPLRVCLIHQNI